MEISASFLTSANLVLLAGGVQAIAMLFRNQVIMRCTLMIGTLLYVIYYLLGVSPPLYEAAVVSGMIGLSTLFGLVRLLLDRSQIMISADLIPIYQAMGGIQPGQFRQLMGLGQRRFLEADAVLTREGITPDNLYFVKSGTLLVEKGTSRFTLNAPMFIGEIAYMTGSPASATIRTGAGVELVEWNKNELRRVTQRKPNLGLALNARLANDLAAKVAAAVSPDATRILTDPAD